MGIVAAAYFAYFLVRGATEGDFHQAVEHAELIRRFEGGLGLFVEPQLQAAVLDTQWIVDVSNWVYVWGHWPVIAGVAIWLYRSDHERYRLVRNAMLISGGIGLVIFTSFPVAPPRLADMGLVDTVVQRSDFYRVLQPPALTNQYAAVPSLHFGWNLLIGIAVFQSTTRLSGRVAGVLSPIAMFAAVVLTGNHYIVDTVVGGTVALVGLRGAYVLRDAATFERRALRASIAAVVAALSPEPAVQGRVGTVEGRSPAVRPLPASGGMGLVEPVERAGRRSGGCAPGMPCGPAGRPVRVNRRAVHAVGSGVASEPSRWRGPSLPVKAGGVASVVRAQVAEGDAALRGAARRG